MLVASSSSSPSALDRSSMGASSYGSGQDDSKDCNTSFDVETTLTTTKATKAEANLSPSILFFLCCCCGLVVVVLGDGRGSLMVVQSPHPMDIIIIS